MANSNTSKGKANGGKTATVKTASGKRGYMPVPSAQVLAKMATRNLR